MTFSGIIDSLVSAALIFFVSIMWRRFKKGNVERDALAEKFKKIASNTDANFAQMRSEGIRSLESVIAFERHGLYENYFLLVITVSLWGFQGMSMEIYPNDKTRFWLWGFGFVPVLFNGFLVFQNSRTVSSYHSNLLMGLNEWMTKKAKEIQDEKPITTI